MTENDEGGPPPFVFERPDAPGLAVIREQVAPVVEDKASELERMIAIRKWVRQEVEYGSASTDPKAENLAADDILREAHMGIKSPCNRLAALFVTACQAAEIPARMVHLSTADGPGHFVAEAWLSEQRRWVMMDPSGNYYTVVDGLPGSVLDLHRALVQGTTSGVELLRDGATSSPNPLGKPYNSHYGVFDYFYSFAVVNRNDFLTHRSKQSDYVLLKWIDQGGAIHRARSEVLLLCGKGAAALLATFAALAAVRLGRSNSYAPSGVL